MTLYHLAFYVAPAWFFARALRHPRDSALWLIVVCLLLRTPDGPDVMPVVRDLVGPSAARAIMNVALAGSWTALLLFFVLAAGGSPARVRREVAVWAGVCVVFVGCVLLTPGAFTAPSLLFAGHPSTVTVFETVGDGYYGYATGLAAVWAWRYARESPRRTRPGLWLAGAGLAVFALDNAVTAGISVLGFPDAWREAVSPMVGWSLGAFALGVCLVGITGRVAAFHVWWRHRRQAQALRPLWSVLHAAYPSDALERASGQWWFDRLLPNQVHRRYWRRWIEIRDGLVQLSPHLVDVGYDPHQPAHQQTEAFEAALGRVAAGKPPSRSHATPVAVPSDPSTKDADVEELIRLSQSLVGNSTLGVAS